MKPAALDRPRRIDQNATVAGIAQLVEQLICNQKVGGSSPSVGAVTPGALAAAERSI